MRACGGSWCDAQSCAENHGGQTNTLIKHGCSHAVAYAQMDAVVHAASTSGAGGAWLKMLREAGLDFWTAFVRECIKVHDFSEAQLCLSLSRSPRRRYLHCLAVWPASCPVPQQTAQRLQRLASRSGLGKITKYIKCDIE